MRKVGAYPVQVKLHCPLGLLSQWGLFVDEDMTIAELLSQYEELAVVEFFVDQEELAVAELLVDQEEWQVHGSRVTRSVFDLTVHAASVGISGHLRKFHVGSTI
jgi:hypothetical protein